MAERSGIDRNRQRGAERAYESDREIDGERQINYETYTKSKRESLRYKQMKIKYERQRRVTERI